MRAEEIEKLRAEAAANACLSAEQEKLLRKIDKMERDITPTILGYLRDPKVIEIMLNPNGEVWLDTLTEGQAFSGYKMPSENAIAFLGSVADSLGETITGTKTIIEGELLLDGSRIEGLRPPTVEAPSFTIRKRASAIYSLEDYVTQGRMKPEHKEYIENAIKNKKNFVVTGGTGSGKTTLTNAFLDAINRLTPEDRIIFIEDTVELQCKQRNQVAMRTNLNTTLHDCVKATMRLRPDRIIIGEVRGAEALDLLKAWNTGHPGGVTTVHSDSALKALSRLQMLVAEGSAAPMQTLIADAVDIVVYIEKTAIGPKIAQIAEVRGYDRQKQEYELHYLFNDSIEKKATENAQWAAMGSISPTALRELEKVEG